PYGSHVSIEGMGTYIAEDCGGGVKQDHIDIYFDTHEKAVAFGTKRLYVTIEPN
nr:3D domain-containing protein [Lachnospiraceae bacterium]